MSSANQTILWNTVNRIPAFIQLSPPKRDLEFKRITEYFYREHAANSPNLSISQLQELNRKTILAFLSPLSAMPSSSAMPSTSSAMPSSSAMPPSSAMPSTSATSMRERPPLHPSTTNTFSPMIPISDSNMVETRQEKQERAFLARQNMYAQMTEKPNLPSPDMFKETEPDEKITNMDELIENYQKQRNLEIPVLPPIIPIVTPSSVPSENRKKNITFLEGNVELNSLEIQDLSISAEGASEKKNLALNDSGEKKNLAWNVNLEETRVIEDSYLQELEKRIVSLEKQIQFLSEIKNERKSEMQEKTQEKTQEKEIQTISISEWETEPNQEVERKEIEEIIESVILSIEQQN